MVGGLDSVDEGTERMGGVRRGPARRLAALLRMGERRSQAPGSRWRDAAASEETLHSGGAVQVLLRRARLGSRAIPYPAAA